MLLRTTQLYTHGQTGESARVTLLYHGSNHAFLDVCSDPEQPNRSSRASKYQQPNEPSLIDLCRQGRQPQEAIQVGS